MFFTQCNTRWNNCMCQNGYFEVEVIHCIFSLIKYNFGLDPFLNTTSIYIKLNWSRNEFSPTDCIFFKVLTFFSLDEEKGKNNKSPLAWWLECSPMARETVVQSRVNHNKDSKMVLDIDLHRNQDYKIRIRGKMEQSSVW